MKDRKPKVIVKKPWQEAAADNQIVAAVKALFAGKASPGQQQTALKWLLIDVCEIPGNQFFAGEDGQRATDYALGKRHVALELARIRDMRIVHKETGVTMGDVPTGKEPDDD